MRNSIRGRLTIILIGLAIGPLALLVLAWRSFNAQQQQALALQRQVTQNVATQVQAFTQELEDELALVAQVQGLHAQDRDQQQAVLAELLSYQRVFEELILLDDQGQEQIYLSRLKIATADDLKDRSGADEFTIPVTTGATYYGPVRFAENSKEPRMLIAMPLSDRRSGLLYGVLIADVRFKPIWDLIASMQVSKGESVYIVGDQGQVIAHRNPSVVLRGTRFDLPEKEGLQTGLTSGRAVLATETIQLGQQALTIVAERSWAEALSLFINTGIIIALLIGITAIIAIGLIWMAVHGIIRPVEALSATARAISLGDLTKPVEVTSEDEIGELAEAFSSMTIQLRELIGDLEQRVAERTADLAERTAELEAVNERQAEINRQLEEIAYQSQRRATLLQASAEVSRAIAQIHDMEQLLPQITQLISQHFGFYTVAIFLIDEAGRYAVLRAANNPNLQQAVAEGQKLRVGAQGIVGHVTSTGQPRVVLNVGEDELYLGSPDLPDTRSEMALPLRVGNEIIGALDVQSAQETTFVEEDVSVLAALADQVAIAIQNARLFRQTQAALAEAQEAQRLYVQQEWARFTKEQPELFHEYTLRGVLPLGDVPLPEAEMAWRQGQVVVADSNDEWHEEHSDDSKEPDDGRDRVSRHAALAAPIKIRDEIIGILDLQETDDERTWSEDEIALVQAVADQIGQALEGARLFEQTQASLAETQALFQTSRGLAAAQEMQDIWQAVIEAARQRRADACALFLFNTMARENARELILSAGWDQQNPPRLRIGSHLLLSDLGLLDVLRPDLPFPITDLNQADDIDEGSRDLLASWGFSALLYQPISVRDRWFGLLNVLYESPHTFTETEINFYRTLADQAALAIESQRLLTETQRRAEREQLIRQITDKVRAKPDVETILQTTVQELSKAMGLPRAFIRLGTEQELIGASQTQTTGTQDDNQAASTRDEKTLE